jgi:EAL domain-containing protein (putative c-di-GMP-specific phosphodiesterase class I)
MKLSGPLVCSVIENDALVPVFQPVVDLRSGEVRGFEVLARWNHPKFGPVLPENFIAIAEREQIIDRLTSQIVRKALHAASSFAPGVGLSFNISPLELRDRGLPSRLHRAFAESAFPSERITIEITESAIIDNLAIASGIAAELKEMGCRLALDDFGTGYSSLRRLGALPFDELKIDRSFVARMTAKNEGRVVVRAVLGLGRTLGMVTVAEGVETEEQHELLLDLDCDAGQGWLYGRPMLAESIPEGAGYAAHMSRHSLRSPLNESRFGNAVPDSAVQLRATHTGAPAGLCFLDPQLRYVNTNASLIYEHLGKTPPRTVPNLFPMVERYIHAALRGDTISGLQGRRTALNGGVDRQRLLSYAPVYDDAAEIVGVSVAAMDVTGIVANPMNANAVPATV